MNPKLHPLFWLLLTFFAWVRDLSWWGSAGDVLPILMALPALYWMSGPWSWSSEPRPLHGTLPVAPLVLLGVLLNLQFPVALGATLYLGAILRSRLDPSHLPAVPAMLAVAVQSYPWIAQDLQWLGWLFRLSGAVVASAVFSMLGLVVERQGTWLVIEGLPLSVEAACSGLNALQSMLLAGSLLIFVMLGYGRAFWKNLLWLPVLAWLANTLRILMLGMVALTFGSDFAMGAFHEISGWIVLILMFLLCWPLLRLQRAPNTRSS